MTLHPVTQDFEGDVFQLANVAIHAHLLPNGQVLYWGRRKNPGNASFDSLNEHDCHPFLFDPQTKKSTPAPQPKDKNGKDINLFCSGHALLPDGRLLVVGGHLFDSEGIVQATIYDPKTNQWSATQEMNHGRWYPTAVTLSDGSVLVLSGNFATGVPQPPPNNMPTANNDIPQVWNKGAWTALNPPPDSTKPPLYPRLHPAPDGRVFMSGTNAISFFFDPRNQGTWTESSTRSAGQREYAPSVLYDVGKIIYIGGGNDQGTNLPSNIVEVIDLNQTPPAWRKVESMHFRRHQHNSTLLPDGTVLVTGGTQGGGGFNNGFNDLTPGAPVHQAELWDPKTEQWTLMDAEAVDRCYHSTALLLPDGSVLSAGGGEYQPQAGVLHPNDAKDSHIEAQIYSPPYMFKPRPDITHAPKTIQYGQGFDVGTSQPNEILKASLLRLGSVTHSFDQNQGVNFLAATAKADKVMLKAPTNANVCPPGHYLLFLLNKAMVPSVAEIVQVQGQPAAAPRPLARAALQVVSPMEKDRAIAENAARPPVVVGLTSTCPYGLAACWGGAYTALHELTGVQTVRPIADARHSVAFVYLDRDGLPDVEKWPTEFARAARRTAAVTSEPDRLTPQRTGS